MQFFFKLFNLWTALIETHAYVDRTETATQYESIQISRNHPELQDWRMPRFLDLNIVAQMNGKNLQTENWSRGTSDQFLQEEHAA